MPAALVARGSLFPQAAASAAPQLERGGGGESKRREKGEGGNGGFWLYTRTTWRAMASGSRPPPGRGGASRRRAEGRRARGAMPCWCRCAEAWHSCAATSFKVEDLRRPDTKGFPPGTMKGSTACAAPFAAGQAVTGTRPGWAGMLSAAWACAGEHEGIECTHTTRAACPSPLSATVRSMPLWTSSRTFLKAGRAIGRERRNALRLFARETGRKKKEMFCPRKKES